MKETQCDKILNHIREHGSINPLQAKDLYGCMRLASRISDLKRQKYPIVSKIEKGENRNGKTVHFAVYRLQGETNV
jgi:hypothetical protein